MFGKAIHIGTVHNVAVKVHPSFALIILWVIYQWGFVADAGLRGIIFGTFVVLAVFACVLAHELAHAVVALRYGLDVHDITLLPIGGVARIEHGSMTPRAETVIALAGPVTNLLIASALSPAVIAVAVVTSIGEALGYLIYPGQLSLVGFIIYLWIANIVLAVFNLLPAFPMDGGRVLRAQLARTRPRLQATQVAVAVGQLFAVVFAVLSLLAGNYLLLLIAVFILVYAQLESRYATVEARMRHLPVGQFALWDTGGIDPNVSIAFATRGGPRDLVVTEGGQVVGMLWRRDLLRHLNGSHHDLIVRDIMDRQIHAVDSNDSIYDVHVWLSDSQRSAVPVVEEGVYRGIMTGERLLHIYQMIAVQEWQRYRDAGRALLNRLRPSVR